MASQPGSDRAARLYAAEEALRKVQAQAAALEELSEQLSLAVHVLEADLAALGEQVRADAEQRSSDAPGQQSPGSARASAVRSARSADVDGARLVALNMALEGNPRDETDRYLAEHFDIAERQTLLDEVYAAARP
jgi:hypothetical protein